MAVPPPAILDEAAAKAVFRPPFPTLNAAAKARKVPVQVVFEEVEPWIERLARRLQIGLTREGWPENDAVRRAIVRQAVGQVLGGLPEDEATWVHIEEAARGRPLAWLYEDDARAMLRRLVPRAYPSGLNLVALSLLLQESAGDDPFGRIIERISRPDLIRSDEGRPDAAAVPWTRPPAPVLRLPAPMVPFAPTPSAWRGASPPPAVAADPPTLPRANRWVDVDVRPPSAEVGGGGAGLAFLVAAMGVAALFRG